MPSDRVPPPPPRMSRRARLRVRQREHRKRDAHTLIVRAQRALQQGQVERWAAAVGIRRLRMGLHALRQQVESDPTNGETVALWTTWRELIRDHYRRGPPLNSRPLIVGSYLGAVMEHVGLPQLVASRAVDSLLPVAVRRMLGQPLVCYRYNTPLLLLTCNWAQASRTLRGTWRSCMCDRPAFRRFCHGDTGHVITKDVNLLRCRELRVLFHRGPSYRLRPQSFPICLRKTSSGRYLLLSGWSSSWWRGP